MSGPYATVSRRTPIHQVSLLSHWLLESRGWRCISMPNFVTIGQSVAKILRFFHFSRWRPLRSWIFEIVNFYLLSVSVGSRRITVPNFVKIGRSVVEILRFFDFSRWRPSAILDLFGTYLDHQQ